MPEIKYSPEGLESAIQKMGDLKKDWESRRSDLKAPDLVGCGGTPDQAHDLAESFGESYNAYIGLALNSKAFFESALKNIEDADADAASQFE